MEVILSFQVSREYLLHFSSIGRVYKGPLIFRMPDMSVSLLIRSEMLGKIVKNFKSHSRMWSRLNKYSRRRMPNEWTDKSQERPGVNRR